MEVLGSGVLAWGLQVQAARDAIRAHAGSGRPTSEPVVAILMAQAQTVPFLVGAALILWGQAGGEYWIAAGVIFTFVYTVVNTWVLLVEILR